MTIGSLALTGTSKHTILLNTPHGVPVLGASGQCSVSRGIVPAISLY